MKKIDIRDFMNYHYPTGLTAAPDGKHGAFAVVDVNEKENCYDSCLWIMDLSDGSVRKLTSGRKERNFSWIDGETLLFAGCREKEYKEKIEDGETWTCFYTIGLHGGEAEFSFAVPYSVGKFAVCGTRVYMSVKYEYAKEEKDYEVFDELPFWANGKGVVNKKRNRLAVYDREKETLEIITPEYETVENFWLEEDCLLYTGVQYTDLKSWRPGLYRVGLEGYERETLIPQDRMRIDYACILKGSVTLFGSEMKTYGVNENPQLSVWRMERLRSWHSSTGASITPSAATVNLQTGKGSSTMTKESISSPPSESRASSVPWTQRGILRLFTTARAASIPYPWEPGLCGIPPCGTWG